MNSMSLYLKQKKVQSLKQLQRLMMSPQMQQAIHLMEVPIMELSQVIQTAVEQNPILECYEEVSEEEDQEFREDEDMPPEEELSFDDNDFEILKRLDEDFRDHFSESEDYSVKRTSEEEKFKSFLEQSFSNQMSLFEYLMQQARETFETVEELKIAEEIIGNLDESGFLKTPVAEIALYKSFPENRVKEVLCGIQMFDPYGVGASDLRESLLIQLRCHKQQDSLAYKIIAYHYDDLLHNRIPKIKKGLKVTAKTIREEIEFPISHLDLHPGKSHSKKVIPYIIPDAKLAQEGETFTPIINNQYLPTVRLNKRYMKMLYDDTLSS